MTVVPKCAGNCGKDVKQNTNGTWRTYCRRCNGIVHGKANASRMRDASLRYRQKMLEEQHARTYQVLCRVARKEMTPEAALDVLVDVERAEYQRGYASARAKARMRGAA